MIYGWTRSPEYDFEDWKVPDDTGGEDAKVVVEVFLCKGDPCHVDSLVMEQALGTREWANGRRRKGPPRAFVVSRMSDVGCSVSVRSHFHIHLV